MKVNYLSVKDINILFVLLSFTVVFDAVNGAISMYFPGILEMFIPMIRVLLLIFYMKLLLKINGKKGLETLLLSLAFLATILLVSLFNEYIGFSMVFEDLMYGIKILNFFLLSVLLFELSFHMEFNWYNKIILNNVYLITLLIIIPTKLNLARQTYINSNLGSMGFYIANNSTNITLVMLIFFLIYNLWFISINKVINFVFLGLSIVSLWLQATKTSFIIIIFVILVNIYFYVKLVFLKKKYRLDMVLVYWGIIFSIIIFLFLYSQKIGEWYHFLFEEFFIRQKYQMKNFSGNKLSFLTSGRIIYLDSLLSNLVVDNNLLNWMFGIGISNIRILYLRITEMDIFDIFFATGFMGVYLTYIHTLLLLRKIKANVITNKFFLCLIMIVIIYSIFAGHVYVDIISTTIFSIVLSSMNTLNSNKENLIDEKIINI